MRKILIVLAAWLAMAGAAQAAICSSYTYTLTNGSTADATQVMSNFNLVRNCVVNNAAGSGANSDITSITGMTTPLSVAQGGTPVFVGGTTTGSGNAQVAATPTPNGFSLTNGYVAEFFAGFSNTGAATLNFGATGAIAIEKVSGGTLIPLVTGDIKANIEYLAVYDGTQYELLNPSTTAQIIGAQTSTDVAAMSSTAGALYDSGVAIASFVQTAGNFITQGVLYATGLNSITSTAAGAAGQLLTSNGTSTAPTFQTPNGPYLVTTLTASNSATLQYTAMSSACSSYEFDFQNLLPATDAVHLYVRVGTSGGGYDSGASSYTFQIFGVAGGVARFTTSGAGAAQITLDDNGISHTASNGGFSGSLTLVSPWNTVASKQFNYGPATFIDTTQGLISLSGALNYVGASTAITQIEFYQSSGNIASGDIKVVCNP